MVHSDDDGLILPPRLAAPRHVVILPIYRDASERSGVMEYVNDLASELRHVPLL